jgi:hypothetical protein
VTAVGEALEVRGGVAGTAARLEDLEHLALLLRQLGGRLGDVAVRVLGVAAAPGLTGTAVVAPGSLAALEGAVAVAVAGPGGLLPLAARFEGLGLAVSAAVRAYRTAELGAAAGVRAAELMVGRSLGSVARLVVPGALPVAAGALRWGSAVRDGPGSTGRSGCAARAGPGAVTAPDGAVEHAVAAVPGALAGVLQPLPWGVPPPGAAGCPWPPVTVGDAIRSLLPAGASGVRGRALRETGRADAVVHRVTEIRPPAGVADVVRRVPGYARPASASHADLHVERVTGPDGRRAWVVAVPGTAGWSPVPGRHPLDLTGALQLMAGRPSAAAAAVAGALGRAGARPGEPVLLAGHSQGGMVAAALAADEGFRSRFTVTHVVTAGSPIAHVPVPAGVSVLALEHNGDVVPHLDGAANPDRPSWVTARGPVRGAAPAAGAAGGVAFAHALQPYAGTAAVVDASAHESLRGWRSGIAPFMDRPGARAEAFTVTATRAGVP